MNISSFKGQIAGLTSSRIQKKSTPAQQKLLKDLFGIFLPHFHNNGLSRKMQKNLRRHHADCFEIHYQTVIYIWLCQIRPKHCHIIRASDYIAETLKLIEHSAQGTTHGEALIRHILSQILKKARYPWLTTVDEILRFVNDTFSLDTNKVWWWKWTSESSAAEQAA